MLSGLGIGCIIATIGLLTYDIKQKKKYTKKKQKPNQIRLALTGGPCGGKSQGINMLYNTLKQITVPVFVVPQAATIIGSAGFQLDLSNCTPLQIELFQIYLMTLQYNFQDLTIEIAKNFERINKKSVILCDRGMMDGKAYAGDENWAVMLEKVKISQEQILERYDAVVHMVTAALGAQQSYQQNQVRHQGIERAINLDKKIQKCYREHPNRFVITNQVVVHDFQEKKKALMVQVYQILIKIIEDNLVDYYQDYATMMRRGSEDDIENQVSPYLTRKLKYKKFIKNKYTINSPRK